VRLPWLQLSFFSWQADTPNGIGRNFVRKALEDACAEIVGDASVTMHIAISRWIATRKASPVSRPSSKRF
jgi:hypothetical protein